MILKLQQGGAVAPPLVSYQPVMLSNSNETTGNTDTTKTSETTDLTDKDLLKMLDKLNGLPSDMTVLTNALQNFYIDQQYGIFPNTANIASKYLQVLSQMNIANFNKNEYDNAFKIVSNNGGLNEVAINDRGQLYCISQDGDFKLLTVEQLKENPDYQALTNSELLNFRAYYPQMAYNNDILKVVQNGIGMDSINKMIKEIINNLGTTSVSKEGYSSKQANQIINGVSLLQDAILKGVMYENTSNMSIDGLYKNKLITKDQIQQAQNAINYIYNTLPTNAKTLLKIKSGGTKEGLETLITQMVSIGLDNTYEFQTDLQENLNIDGTKKETSKKSTSKDETNLKSSLPLNVMKSNGITQSVRMDTGNGISMIVTGSYFPQIKTPSGQPITNTSLETMLSDSGLQGIIQNTRNITFGDQKLSPEQLSKITYNNTGLVRANLPVKEDGTVNIELLEQFQKAENEIQLLGENPNPEQVANIYKEFELDELLTSNGQINPNKFASFMMVEGYTTESNNIVDSNYVKHIKNPTDEQIKLIKDSLTVGTGENKEVPYIDTFNIFNVLDWFGVENIYKGVVYIPITNNTNMAIIGANQNIDYDESLTQQSKYRNFDKINRLKSTSSDVL